MTNIAVVIVLIIGAMLGITMLLSALAAYNIYQAHKRINSLMRRNSDRIAIDERLRGIK